VLFALNDRYLINEKGALAEASTFALTIEDLPETIAAVWALLGNREFSSLIACLRALGTHLDHLVAQTKVLDKEHH
jgi:hypothetical protein